MYSCHLNSLYEYWYINELKQKVLTNLFKKQSTNDVTWINVPCYCRPNECLISTLHVSVFIHIFWSFVSTYQCLAAPGFDLSFSWHQTLNSPVPLPCHCQCLRGPRPTTALWPRYTWPGLWCRFLFHPPTQPRTEFVSALPWWTSQWWKSQSQRDSAPSLVNPRIDTVFIIDLWKTKSKNNTTDRFYDSLYKTIQYTVNVH